MKVRNGIPTGRALVAAATSAAFAAILLFSSPAPAHAVTRADILARASGWVKKKVSYSQHRFYKGYRRDCSGFVSMAWKLGTSLSSRTIARRASRISQADLQPGDAVLVPGHVALFGGWKNRAKRTYWAIEETTWGDHARRHVRRLPKRAIALRRKGLEPAVDSASVAIALPSTEPSVPVVAAASVSVVLAGF